MVKPSLKTKVSKNTREINKLKQVAETKTFDVVDLSLIPLASDMSPISLIGQGDGETNREGVTCMLESVQLKAEVITNPAETVGSFCRIIVFIDNEADGVLPLATELLETDTTSSLRNGEHRFMKRFNILFDEHFFIGLDTAGNPSKKIDRYKRWKMPKKMVYFGGGSAIGNAMQGNVFIYRKQNLSLTPATAIHTRLKFKG